MFILNNNNPKSIPLVCVCEHCICYFCEKREIDCDSCCECGGHKEAMIKECSKFEERKVDPWMQNLKKKIRRIVNKFGNNYYVCQNCGCVVNASDVFCTACGIRLQDSDPSPILTKRFGKKVLAWATIMYSILIINYIQYWVHYMAKFY